MSSSISGRPTDAAMEPGETNGNWSGTVETLNVDQNANMPQTANGTMIFMYWNQSTQNNDGTLSLSSGGSTPTPYDAPALSFQPSLVMANWASNNLSVTNTSVNSNTPIYISAYGPGVPGQISSNLPVGKSVPLQSTHNVQGQALPQYMNLVMQCQGATLCVIGVIGGPLDTSGNNGYVFALNASENTGPNTGVAAPAGYYATAKGNTYTFPFNWGSATVYVVNMSPATSLIANVELVQS